MVKMNRLLKILKMLKFKGKLKENSGYERMIFFFLIFLILIHIMACFWIIIPQFQNDDATNYEGTWLQDLVETNSP